MNLVIVSLDFGMTGLRSETILCLSKGIILAGAE